MKIDKVFKAIFCFVFFTFLFVPMLNISNEEKSLQENRMLEKFPKLLNKKQFNYDFGIEFEYWLNDRFWGRTQALDIYTNLNRINTYIRNKKAVYFKSNGWMFSSYPFFREIKKEKIENAVKNIRNVLDFCEKNNIKMYILVVPTKELIYQEYIEDKYVNLKETNKYLLSMEKIKENLGNTLVWIYSDLKEASKNEMVFFKETHHWTENGAYIGYLRLMESIKKDFKDVQPVFSDKYKVFKDNLIREDWNRRFECGETTKLLNISPDYAKRHILKSDYIYYDPLDPISQTVTNIPYYKVKHFVNLEQKYKVFLTGFSQNENLLQFLPYSFKELKYYRLNNVKDVKSEEVSSFWKRYKKDLLEFKPDILIFTISPLRLFSKELWEIN